jgi:hypothetical protein
MTIAFGADKDRECDPKEKRRAATTKRRLQTRTNLIVQYSLY